MGLKLFTVRMGKRWFQAISFTESEARSNAIEAHDAWHPDDVGLFPAIVIDVHTIGDRYYVREIGEPGDGRCDA